MGFEVVEGFSRPNWKTIRSFIEGRFSSDQKGDAWSGAAELWLAQLAHDLGGASHVYASENFLCLSDLPRETARSVLSYAESVRGIIRGVLGQAAWSGYSGKHVLLVFSDQDDYFTYISYFYGDGAHAMSSGIFIRTGYAHIALPYSGAWSTEHVLPHEMTHNLLCHLPIPVWLNEGLAVTIENRVSRHGLRLDQELIERHRSFWAENNIQEFWSGASFQVPGDSIELSYSLAEVFVNLLSEKGSGFVSFIASANWRDAGQDAALNTLNLDLGELAAGFLGPGSWRPQRKVIAERTKAKS